MYYYYLLYMLPALILTMAAQFFVKSTYKKYSSVASSRGLTGAECARRVLEASGSSGVQIDMIQGNLSDNYDPRSNTIHLSQQVYSSQSVAALGVAAHEAGHAVQYAKGYAPVKLRTVIYPACSFGSRCAMYLLLIGAFAAIPVLYYAGIGAFMLAALFQLVTLPVEFNASRRAISALDKESILTGEELSGAKKVLTAAAMTYIAALFVSFLQIVYLLSRTGNRR